MSVAAYERIVPLPEGPAHLATAQWRDETGHVPNLDGIAPAMALPGCDVFNSWYRNVNEGRGDGA